VRKQRQVASDAGLSRQRVVVEAVRLADREGVDGLSMRRLAGALGAGAMSLYYYVASKEELLDAMIDVVFEEIELPPEETDWQSAMRRRADIAGAREPPPPRSGHRLPAEGWLPGLDGDARQLVARQLCLRSRPAGSQPAVRHRR
jgi:AcrR family transcriptional regulator